MKRISFTETTDCSKIVMEHSEFEEAYCIFHIVLKFSAFPLNLIPFSTFLNSFNFDFLWPTYAFYKGGVAYTHYRLFLRAYTDTTCGYTLIFMIWMISLKSIRLNTLINT